MLIFQAMSTKNAMNELFTIIWILLCVRHLKPVNATRAI
uniref:Uncharacterized protein n=1 Tax=Escherichia coli TaxID=562 RepID=A0A2U8T2W9_ECOLX|nr:hypothetical protein [Escherichia coli]